MTSQEVKNLAEQQLKRLMMESEERAAVRRKKQAERILRQAAREQRQVQRTARNRANETAERTAARKQRNAQRTALVRATETAEQTAARKHKQAERMAFIRASIRANETAEQSAARRQKEADRVALVRASIRANETAEETAARRAAQRARRKKEAKHKKKSVEQTSVQRQKELHRFGQSILQNKLLVDSKIIGATTAAVIEKDTHSISSPEDLLNIELTSNFNEETDDEMSFSLQHVNNTENFTEVNKDGISQENDNFSFDIKQEPELIIDDINNELEDKSSSALKMFLLDYIDQLEHSGHSEKLLPESEEAYNTALQSFTNENILFICPICKKQFDYRNSFTDHIIEVHKFDTVEGLHLQEIFDDNKQSTTFKCSDCAAFIETQINPVAHRITHISYDIFKCRFCNKPFPKGAELKNHFTKCKESIEVFQRKLKADKTNKKITLRNSSIKLHFACPYCEMIFYTFQESIDHRRTAHAFVKNSKSLTTKESQLNDKLPKKSTNMEKSTNLNIYELAELKCISEHITYLCPECKEPFPNFILWENHLINIHKFFDEDKLNFKRLPDGKAECNECGRRRTPYRSILHQHKLQHTKIKSFICNICDFRSHSKVSMDNHVRRIHFTPGEFKCPICVLIFNTSYGTILHCRTDHNENEYPAYFCSTCFSYRSSTQDLKQHKLLHSVNSIALYKCYSCDQAFKTIDFLRAHLCKKIKEFAPIVCQTNNYKRSSSSINGNDMIKIHGENENMIVPNRGPVPKNAIDLKSDRVHDLNTEIGQTYIGDQFMYIHCPICNKELSTTKYLWKHLNIIHSFDESLQNLRVKELRNDGHQISYKCLDCDEKISEINKSLLYHRFSHFPYKPYKCRHCCREFIFKPTATQHAKLCKKQVAKMTSRNNKTTEIKTLNNDGPLILLNSKSDIHNENARESYSRGGKNSPTKNHGNKLFNLVYACAECNKLFKSERKWKLHILTKHEFLNRDNLNFTFLSEDQAQCNECNVKTKSYNVCLQEHKMKHMPFKSFMCNICSHRSAMKTSMLKHIKKMHLTKYSSINLTYLSYRYLSYACCKCNKLFKSQGKWKLHIKLNHKFLNSGNLNFTLLSGGQSKCNECKLKIRSTNICLQEHKMKHMPYKSFVCSICSYRLNVKTSLLRHIKSVHFAGESECTNLVPNYGRNISDCTEKQQPLTECVKNNASYSLVNYKMYISYACPECNISLSTYTDWQMHIVQNHKFFDEDQLNLILLSDGSVQCNDCSALIKSPVSSLKQDHKLLHMPIKSFVCTICSLRTLKRNDLLKHIREEHFTMGTFLCPICEKVFETSFHYIAHCKTDHNEYPPNFCSLCMSAFLDPLELEEHMSVHSCGNESWKLQQSILIDEDILIKVEPTDGDILIKVEPTDEDILIKVEPTDDITDTCYTSSEMTLDVIKSESDIMQQNPTTNDTNNLNHIKVNNTTNNFIYDDSYNTEEECNMDVKMEFIKEEPMEHY